MTRRHTELLEFAREDPSRVVDTMDRLTRVHDGWINLHPEVRPEDEPPRPSGFSLLVAGVSHDVPVATWVPGKLARDGLRPDSIGIQHAAGGRVLARLASAGVGLPDGWRTVQDHPRRGLIVAPGASSSHRAMLDWLLEAATALSAVRLTGEWRAEVYLPNEA
jgi:hypothetical protein